MQEGRRKARRVEVALGDRGRRRSGQAGPPGVGQAEGRGLSVKLEAASFEPESFEALAEGLTEEVVTDLSRFSYLRVIARSSTARFAGQSIDVRAVGSELGARYVMEGNVRGSGSRVRIAAQLVDAVSGAHLWAESYDRGFRPEETFELQDELVPTIVSTIADMNGVLPHAMSEALREKDAAKLTPYEAVLRSFGYVARLDAE